MSEQILAAVLYVMGEGFGPVSAEAWRAAQSVGFLDGNSLSYNMRYGIVSALDAPRNAGEAAPSKATAAVRIVATTLEWRRFDAREVAATTSNALRRLCAA